MPFIEFKPATPVLVADTKLEDYQQALIETALFAHCVSHVGRDEQCPVVLEFPVTRTCASLYLFGMANNKLWGIPIVESVHPCDNALLCTLYSAVQHLCANSIHHLPLFNPIPFKDVAQYSALVDGRQPFKTSDGQVVKIFDTTDLRLSTDCNLMETSYYCNNYRTIIRRTLCAVVPVLGRKS